MKKIFPKSIVFFLIFLSTSFLVGCQNSETSRSSSSLWENIEKNKTIKVATSGTLFPVSYYDDQNQLTGYEVELVREMARRLNLEVEFYEYSVEGILIALQQEKVDIAINDFSLNEQRSQRFDLSVPTKYSFGSLLMRKEDAQQTQSLNNLAGKKAAGETGTTFMQLAEFIGAKPIYYDNATNDQYLLDLANGRTDVILNDYYLQKMAVENFPDYPIEMVDNVYYQENETGILLLKNQTELASHINQKLIEMHQDWTLSKLAIEFFGEDASHKRTDLQIEDVTQNDTN